MHWDEAISVKRLLHFVATLAIASFLSGCPPNLYCSIVNHSRGGVKIDFEYNGSGTLLPHFVLRPNESRRVTTQRHLVIVAHDLYGRLIGSFDLSRLNENSPYFNPRTYTFSVAVDENGVAPIGAPQ